MADDCRISTALPRHPKMVKLKRRLQAQGAWAFLCLLLWVADNRYDGNLAGMAQEDIEIAADWDGEPGALAAALREVGFLDGEDGSYRIHDWSEHNPWAATRAERVAAAREAARIRWERERAARRSNSACDPHANGMHGACASDETAMPSSPLLSSPPNQKKNHSATSVALQPSTTAPRERGSRIPESFVVTDEHRSFARSHGLTSPDKEIDKFRDYWRAQSGSRAVKRDWDATFRNWLRNAPEMSKGRGPTASNLSDIDYSAGLRSADGGVHGF